MIYIIDDEDPVRDSLGWLLRSRSMPSMAFDSAEAFLAALDAGSIDPSRPGCILLDVRMAGLSGAELFERLQGSGRCRAWPVIFLTGHGDVPLAVDVLKGGAFDFVEKPFNDNSLADLLATALVESEHRLDSVRSRKSLDQQLAALTARERQVMDLIIEGHYNKVVADRLGIAMRTVEVYRARLFGKMGVKSAVELAARVASRKSED